MIVEPNRLASPEGNQVLPEMPHDVPFDRARVDALVDRARTGGRVDLLSGLLDAVDWSTFASEDGAPLSVEALAELRAYYRAKWGDIGPLFIAELLSTEFMTEQRARGDVVFSERLLRLGRTEPDLWQEIRLFFRRKEMVTALLAAAHDPSLSTDDTAPPDNDDEDLWE